MHFYTVNKNNLEFRLNKTFNMGQLQWYGNTAIIWSDTIRIKLKIRLLTFNFTRKSQISKH